MSRPGRPPPVVPRQVAVPPAPKRWGLGAGVVLGVAVLLAALLWAWPKSPPATVRLETVPPGATVVFNGQELAEKTPLVLPPVAAGQYSVVVSRDGYEELRTTVDVPATGTASPGLLRLAPAAQGTSPAATPRGEPPASPPPGPSGAIAPVRLRVETEPSAALVSVDGQRQGPSPVELDVVAGREVAVRVEAPLHHPLVRAVKVGNGLSQVERFVLAEAGASSREEPARGDGRTARVKFAVQPWAQVTCSGKRLGETPFDAVELRVGSHECRFFNPESKKTLNRRIEVRAIDLNVVNVKLE
jgi:hypothetical protein